jgi:hypothetical protein
MLIFCFSVVFFIWLFDCLSLFVLVGFVFCMFCFTLLDFVFMYACLFWLSNAYDEQTALDRGNWLLFSLLHFNWAYVTGGKLG